MDSRRGFTIVELLVALVIGSLIAGSVLQAVAAQSRFVQMQSAREEVQQNTRAALELIGGELRGLPPGGGLVRADRDSITFRSPAIWGVVCGEGGSSTLDAVFPVIPDFAIPTNLGSGVVANLGTIETPEWTGSVSLINVGSGFGDCDGAEVPAGSERRTLTMSSPLSIGERTASRGDVIYTHELISYRTGVSSGLPGRWIRRRIGDGPGTSNQPFAGPVTEGGLRFEYFSGDSPAPLPSPLSSAALRGAVDRIAVTVEAVSRYGVETVGQTKADTVLITPRGRG